MNELTNERTAPASFEEPLCTPFHGVAAQLGPAGDKLEVLGRIRCAEVLAPPAAPRLDGFHGVFRGGRRWRNQRRRQHLPRKSPAECNTRCVKATTSSAAIIVVVGSCGARP